MEFTFTFLKIFAWALYFVSPLLLLLASMIIFIGQIVTHIEKWDRFNGFYWSCVTATTVGYGDIRPLKKISKTLSILIALLGIILTGIILSTAIESISLSLEKHLDPSVIERIKQDL